MRVLIIQMQACSAVRAAPRFSQLLGVLAASLRAEGHELELAAFARYQAADLHEVICRFRPEAIYVEADRFAADETRHAVEFIGRTHQLPVVIGGLYPTAQPHEALSIPGALAIAIGEPELSVPRFLWSMQHGEAFERTAGIWAGSPDGPVMNALAPLAVDLDRLPFAERELFDTAARVRQTGTAEVSVGRGCPQRCAYCLNDWLTEIYSGCGPWVRRRSPANVCDEIDALCERYAGIERIAFVDHLFALDVAWLADFARLYADRCGLPFSCHLRANAAAEAVGLLADAGCDRVTVELISGSDFIRNEVFRMELSDAQIEAAFARLRARGIHTAAVNLVGSPYETTVTLERTVELTERAAPDQVRTHLFAPMPGTEAEQLCRECGWLSGLGERAFRERRPMLQMPALPPDDIAAALDQFSWQARHPRWGWLMQRLAAIRLGRRRSLYDLLVRSPAPNGRLLPADPRAVEVAEADGAMRP